MTINTNLEFDGAAPNNARLQKVLNDIASVIGTGAAANLPGVVICPSAAPGAYTLANSGVVFKNLSGVEIWRIWGTDPDDVNDFNSANLYVGRLAGASQPTDNVSAGFQNTGIGASTLESITTGNNNTALGDEAGNAITTGSFNLFVGSHSGNVVTTGTKNTFVGVSSASPTVITGEENVSIGYGGGPLTDLSGTITIGASATASVSNICVIGENTLTDTYFGSETASSKIHAAKFIPASVPTITGSRAGNAALASLLTNLATLGLIVDGTSA